MLQLVQGDITTEPVDAIVNAANERLQHGGGVAWAILRRGGEIIQQESVQWVEEHGPVSHSKPAWTSAGLLPARYVIHAVGPVWGDGDEDAKLAAAVRGSLRVADELGLNSIAFPSISTGIFGFPKARAAGVFLKAIRLYFDQTPGSGLKIVRVILFDQPTLDAFIEVWKDWAA
jgi:O-acetyl-ADP-ribose deacetylase (regulator of RNase III)